MGNSTSERVVFNIVSKSGKTSVINPINSSDTVNITSENPIIADNKTLTDILNRLKSGAFSDSVGGGTGGDEETPPSWYHNASETSDGLMSSEGFIKLKNIEDGAQRNVITGVKGSADETYQTGNVTIGKENIGLDRVENTADREKIVLSASKLTNKRNITLTGAITGSAGFDGSSDAILNINAINTSYLQGVISTENLPENYGSGIYTESGEYIERMIIVPTEEDRLNLSDKKVRIGDIVKVTKTGNIYRIMDPSRLTDNSSYEIFSVNWDSITGKPDEIGQSELALDAGILSEEQPDTACLWFHEL